MKAADIPFQKFIEGTKQFVIPVFQRDYIWSEDQCVQLWQDVLKVGQGDSTQRHFLGSVVHISTADSGAAFGRWLLIDGQQRLATLTLMMCALRDHIQKTDWKGGENGPTAARIDAYFLKNVHEEGDRQHKLVLRRHDQATLRALIEQTNPPKEASDRLQENYDFFRDKVLESDPTQIYIGLRRLVVVEVVLDRQNDDPQLIFESLNSTGLDLSQSDLIRNFILMRLEESEQTQLYERFWSKIEACFQGSEKTFDVFLRDYLAIKTKASKQEKADEIYRAFRRWTNDSEFEPGSHEDMMKDMLRFAGYHSTFSFGGDVSKALNESLSRLRRLFDVPATLVMVLFECYERFKTLSESEFIESLSAIESYYFRRYICGEQSRGYWAVFANLAYRINNDDPLGSLMAGLARQSQNYRFPKDNEFRDGLREKELYGLRHCNYLLERLENYGSREMSDTSSYSIEHIMPQNENLIPEWRKMLGDDWRELHGKWIHRLGNLTLTAYNSTYSDRSFEEKKSITGGFSESSVRLNKFVRDQSVWTVKEMKRRNDELSEKALKIWKPLVVDQKLIDAAKRQENLDRASRRDVSKVKMTEITRKLFIEFSQRLPELGDDVIEIAETRSISYHRTNFFLEVLPRKHGFALLLSLDFNEVNDVERIAEDATQWKFLFYAKYEGGVVIPVKNSEDIERAWPIIRQSYALE